jgi:hypothetical protein
MLIAILKNIAGCRDGRLKEIEDAFYRGLANLHAAHAPRSGAPVAKAS